MARRVPEGPPPPPVVQRIRLRYAKRGRLRFVSHRDFARAFERALRRAGVPMAYSAGFTPHPKVSYVGAAPTGAASEAEFVEIGLAERVDVDRLRAALDAALPDGLDIVDAVEATGGTLAERIEASEWRLHVDAEPALLAGAVAAFNAAGAVEVERLTKDGRRRVDVRAAVCALDVSVPGGDRSRAILHVVVRQASNSGPSVRPDDVVAALRAVAGLAHDAPRWDVQAVRLAQGPLDDAATVGDPLAADHAAAASPSGQSPTRQLP